MSSVTNSTNVLNLANYAGEQNARSSAVSNELMQGATAKKVTETEAPAAMSKENLTDAINTLNQVPVIKERNLSFSVDDISGRSVIKLRDKKTDEVIKQIPSEELLKVAQDVKRLQEQMGQSIGLLVDNKV